MWNGSRSIGVWKRRTRDHVLMRGKTERQGRRSSAYRSSEYVTLDREKHRKKKKKK
jgi:hypothetical protein